MNEFPYEGIRYYFFGNDASFRSKLAFLEGNLPPEIERMRGFRQSPFHGGLDPVEHTLNLLSLLDTAGLDNYHAELLRIAGFFHDSGKEDTPEGDPEHPARSALIAAKAAMKMRYPLQDVYMISKLAGTHTRIAEHICGKVSEEDMLAELDASEVMLTLHHRLILADTESRPGQTNGFAGKINEAYQRLMAKLKNGANR